MRLRGLERWVDFDKQWQKWWEVMTESFPRELGFVKEYSWDESGKVDGLVPDCKTLIDRVKPYINNKSNGAHSPPIPSIQNPPMVFPNTLDEILNLDKATNGCPT